MTIYLAIFVFTDEQEEERVLLQIFKVYFSSIILNLGEVWSNGVIGGLFSVEKIVIPF
jgi:hypothetical protein